MVEGLTPLSIGDEACCWCGLPFRKRKGSKHLGPTWDHIVPRSRGGSDDPKNLRRAHRFCNSTRGNDDFATTRRVAVERPMRHRGGWATPAAHALRLRFKEES